MFNFKRSANVWSHCNTDINYLKRKEFDLTDLTKIKERIILCISELDEDFENKYRNFCLFQNLPFTPQQISNYQDEVKNHYALLRQLEKEMNELLKRVINNFLASSNSKSRTLKSAIDTENIKIKECKNKYPEASNLIIINNGGDLLIIEQLAQQALLAFKSSPDYVQVLNAPQFKK